jgi:hypothetical protein
VERVESINLMQALIGTTIKTPSWLEQLRPVMHLVFFETPLVTHMRSSSGENFLKVWCDVDSGINRYCLFSLTQEILESYREQSISLRDLLISLQDGFVYFLDETATHTSVKIVSGESFPVEYLPDADSRFDPLVTAEAQESPTYEIFLNNELDLEELKALPHKFSQAYALLYCLDDARSSNVPSVKNAFNAYPWRGGFSRMHFYNHLKQIVPAEVRGAVRSMHYASPGWIELEIDKPTGLGIGSLVELYIIYLDEILDLVKTVEAEMTRRKLRSADIKGTIDGVSAVDLQFCAASFEEITRLWGFTQAKNIQKLATNELAALKILLSFQRRIHSLAKLQISEKARFEK